MPPEVAEPLVTDLPYANDLLQIVSSIGMRDTDEASPHVYHRGVECRGVLGSGMGRRAAQQLAPARCAARTSSDRCWVASATTLAPT